jgi:thiol-disulfide isomerase/thioredoxin
MKLFAVFLFLIAFMIGACRPAAAPISIGNKPVSRNDAPLKDAPVQPLKPVAEMNWTEFEGSVHKIKDFHGKVVILDFWATYCAPCIEEIPHLKELQAKYGEENLRVFGLHVGGEEDRPKVPEFVDRLKITYPLAIPEDALTGYVFGQQTAIPQTAIFGRDGRLIKKITGFDPQIKAELDQAVEQAVNSNE